MEQGPSCEANSHLASEEILCIAVSTRARHWSLSWANESSPQTPTVIVYQQLKSGHEPQRGSGPILTDWMNISCKVTQTQTTLFV